MFNMKSMKIHEGLVPGAQVFRLLLGFAVPGELSSPACALSGPSCEASFNEVPSFAHFEERLGYGAEGP